MYEGQMVFPQLLEFLPRRIFDSCVRRYQGHRRVRGFSCRDQFLAMAFAQLTGRESLRDLEIRLRAVSDKLYHAGFRGAIGAAPWPTPTERATGKSIATWGWPSSSGRGPCTRPTILASS